MSNKGTYVLAMTERETPLHTDYRWYQELLHAFGLGPFSFEEMSGALMHCSQSREDIKKIVAELERNKMLEYIG